MELSFPGVELREVHPSVTWLVPLATVPRPEAFQGPPGVAALAQSPDVVERGLLRVTKDAPVTPATQEIPKILAALSQEPGTKTKYVFPTITRASGF